MVVSGFIGKYLFGYFWGCLRAPFSFVSWHGRGKKGLLSFIFHIRGGFWEFRLTWLSNDWLFELNFQFILHFFGSIVKSGDISTQTINCEIKESLILDSLVPPARIIFFSFGRFIVLRASSDFLQVLRLRCFWFDNSGCFATRFDNFGGFYFALHLGFSFGERSIWGLGSRKVSS